MSDLHPWLLLPTLLLACDPVDGPPSRSPLAPAPLTPMVQPPEVPDRPASPPVVRTVADLLRHDREWVELQGVVAPVRRTAPPKPHWSVAVEMHGGVQVYPEHHGEVERWKALEGQAVRVVGLLSLCGTWATSQVAGGTHLALPESPQGIPSLEVPTRSEPSLALDRERLAERCGWRTTWADVAEGGR